MQALQAELNPGSQVKSVKGSKQSKASSNVKNTASKSKKFAEVFEQMLLPQTAVLESKVKQLGNKEELNQTFGSTGERLKLTTVLGQGIKSDTKKSKITEAETKLIDKGLSKQSSIGYKTAGSMEKGTATTDAKTGATGKPNSNEIIKLANDQTKLQLHKAEGKQIGETEETKVTLRSKEANSNEIIKLSVDESKLVKAEGRQSGQVEETKDTSSARKTKSEGTIKLADVGIEEIKTEGKAGSKAEKVKSIKPELKEDHSGEVKDGAGEAKLVQPDINNDQAMTIENEADKSVMSKSQMDFIVTNMAGQIKSGASSLEINLKPEYLGKIKLLLQSNEGSLSIRIIAQNGETLNLLNSNLQNIKDNLDQQGIKLTDMSVNLANQEKQGNQAGNGYREESRPGQFFRQSNENYETIGSGEHSTLQSYSTLNILA